ncbi:MAG TPA: alpha-L-glutamate ligase, partial [Thermodesulfobacteriota bacterium]
DAFCPTVTPPSPRFRILPSFDDPIVERYRRFLEANGIGIAGIEFIADAAGEIYTYDVNTNTNYNAAAEAEAGRAGTPGAGMRAIARYLGAELTSRYACV